MNISIVGTGYVGLVTGVCFAERGHTVICVDYDQKKIDSINRGVAPFFEEGLDPLLSRNIGSRLRVQSSLEGAVEFADIVFICVGTPFDEGQIDLSQVISSARQIGALLKVSNSYKTVVVKSTVIPGTTSGIVRETLERTSNLSAGKDFGLCMNPEFLTEGTAVNDFINPDRIVVGGIDDQSRNILASVYKDWIGVEYIHTNTSTAEMIKYASNSVLATMISFSNEIACLCSAVGSVDVNDVMKGVHKSAYFTHRGYNGKTSVAPITRFLGAGCGFGGSCLPKDVSALVAQGKANGLSMPLLSSVLKVNREQPEYFVGLASKHYPEMSGVRVAILGLAFKPDTDDLRESPAFPVISLLKKCGAIISVYDPVAQLDDHPALTDVEIRTSLAGVVSDAEIVFLITRWTEFLQLPEVLRHSGRQPLVVDGRRFLNPGDFKRYEGVGL